MPSLPDAHLWSSSIGPQVGPILSDTKNIARRKESRRIYPNLFLTFLTLSLPLHAQTTAPPAPPQTHTQTHTQTQDQITVTATRSSTPIGETARTTSTLTAAQLHNYPAVTLDEALRQHAGFELFRRAGSRIANPTSEGISLRGLGSTAASRTLVLEDGAPLNDPFGGWVYFNESPQQTIRSATLVTGGGSDLYGSSALGGVIAVTPSTPSPTRLDLSAAGASQSTSDLTATLARTTHLLNGLLAGESLRTAGYIVTAPALAGQVDTPANVRSQSYRGELGRRDDATSRLFLTGNLLNQDHHNGTPLQTNATRLWRYLAGYDLPENRIASARLRAFGSDEGYRQSFSSIVANRNSETLTRLQRVHTEEFGGTGDATFRFGHVAFVTGADLRDIRATDNETPIANGAPTGLVGVSARQRFLGGFGELLGQYRSWSAALSLRADRASNLSILQTTRTLAATSIVTPQNRTEIVLSPRLGLIRTLGPNLNVHASAFRAFRAPTMNELYRTGQVGQETTLANAQLNSERATGFEIGTQLTTPSKRVPTSLQATYFWTEINRPVSAVLVSQTATTITNQRQNLGQIRSDGIELALTTKPLQALTTTIGYQFAQATVTKFSAQPTLVGNWIPQVPRNSLTAQLRAQSDRFGQLTLAARSSGMAFDDAANQFPLAAFYSVDFSGSRALLTRGTHHLDLFFLVQNLTNQRAQVARTPILTLGSPIYGEAGLRLSFTPLKP